MAPVSTCWIPLWKICKQIAIFLRGLQLFSLLKPHYFYKQALPNIHSASQDKGKTLSTSQNKSYWLSILGQCPGSIVKPVRLSTLIFLINDFIRTLMTLINNILDWKLIHKIVLCELIGNDYLWTVLGYIQSHISVISLISK